MGVDSLEHANAAYPYTTVAHNSATLDIIAKEFLSYSTNHPDASGRRERRNPSANIGGLYTRLAANSTVHVPNTTDSSEIMRKFILTTLTIFTTIGLSAQKQCVINGTVVDRTSKVLLVRKCSESFRSFINKPTKIPIKQGRFDYTFQYVETEAYELIFEDELENGSWRAITFFSNEWRC